MVEGNLRVLVVDDDRALRGRLRQLLVEELPIAAVGEASSAEEALLRVKLDAWDVVVLDIHLPGRSGLDVLPTLKSVRPSCHVVVVTGLPEDPYARAALRSGAAAFLLKERAPEALAQTISRLCAVAAS